MSVCRSTNVIIAACKNRQRTKEARMEGKLTLFVTVPLVRKHKNSEHEGSNFGNCQQALDEMKAVATFAS